MLYFHHYFHIVLNLWDLIGVLLMTLCHCAPFYRYCLKLQCLLLFILWGFTQKICPAAFHRTNRDIMFIYILINQFVRKVKIYFCGGKDVCFTSQMHNLRPCFCLSAAHFKVWKSVWYTFFLQCIKLHFFKLHGTLVVHPLLGLPVVAHQPIGKFNLLLMLDMKMPVR